MDSAFEHWDAEGYLLREMRRLFKQSFSHFIYHMLYFYSSPGLLKEHSQLWQCAIHILRSFKVENNSVMHNGTDDGLDLGWILKVSRPHTSCSHRKTCGEYNTEYSIPVQHYQSLQQFRWARLSYRRILVCFKVVTRSMTAVTSRFSMSMWRSEFTSCDLTPAEWEFGYEQEVWLMLSSCPICIRVFCA